LDWPGESIVPAAWIQLIIIRQSDGEINLTIAAKVLSCVTAYRIHSFGRYTNNQEKI